MAASAQNYIVLKQHPFLMDLNPVLSSHLAEHTEHSVLPAFFPFKVVFEVLDAKPERYKYTQYIGHVIGSKRTGYMTMTMGSC